MTPKKDYGAAGPRAAFIAGVLAAALRALLTERGDLADPLWLQARRALDQWEAFTRER